MRFQLVKPSSTPFVAPCWCCSTRLDSAIHEIWADLDGPAYQAYYCGDCHEALASE